MFWMHANYIETRSGNELHVTDPFIILTVLIRI
jgi:hypothetical protein